MMHPHVKAIIQLWVDNRQRGHPNGDCIRLRFLISVKNCKAERCEFIVSLSE